MAAAEEKSWTYKDYARLPEGAPCQLIGGSLIMTPSPTPYHQTISMKLGVKLALHALEKGLGLALFAPVDVYFEETETYQPDIIFIAGNRMSIVEKTRINGAPDLVVEILSPGTAYYDLRKKFKTYEKHGVKEYWVVDPGEQSVEIYTRANNRFSLEQKAEKTGPVESHVIPGFTVEIESIF
ncbi:restriction endonuclease [Desulfotomaculum copahuensis]|uniref:Restriction endonuclease n=2 Tax=Desulfotomaculum copahuensis TaxID=1838280 RepID=A0A1B7LBY2_9FIRM|nr:restriction endonuclease [Desulfotomaculum copahuensis]